MINSCILSISVEEESGEEKIINEILRRSDHKLEIDSIESSVVEV